MSKSSNRKKIQREQEEFLKMLFGAPEGKMEQLLKKEVNRAEPEAIQSVSEAYLRIKRSESSSFFPHFLEQISKLSSTSELFKREYFVPESGGLVPKSTIQQIYEGLSLAIGEMKFSALWKDFLIIERAYSLASLSQGSPGNHEEVLKELTSTYRELNSSYADQDPFYLGMARPSVLEDFPEFLPTEEKLREKAEGFVAFLSHQEEAILLLPLSK